MIDHVHDSNGAGLLRLSTVVEFPPFVKSASIPSPEDVADLDSSAFADQRNRLFPLHTAADTWLSAAYILKQFGDNVKVASDQSDLTIDGSNTPISVMLPAVEKAAAFWGITKEASAIADQFLNLYAVPPQDQAFPIEFKLNDRVDDISYVGTPGDVVKLGSYIIENRRELPFEKRSEAARQLLVAGEHLRTNYPGTLKQDLQKTAGMGMSDLDHILPILEDRRRQYAVKLQPLEREIDNIIELVKQAAGASGLLDGDVLSKTAGYVDAMDRLIELHKQPAVAPVESFFQATLDDGLLFRDGMVKLSNGVHVPKAKLASCHAIMLLTDAFGASPKDSPVQAAAALSPAHADAFVRELTA